MVTNYMKLKWQLKNIFHLKISIFIITTLFSSCKRRVKIIEREVHSNPSRVHQTRALTYFTRPNLQRTCSPFSPQEHLPVHSART